MREDYYSDNQVKKIGLVVQTSSRGTKWRLELRKLTGALKTVAAAITAAAESGLWVGLSARDGSENFIQDTKYFASSHIFAVMNFQVHPIIFHKALAPASSSIHYSSRIVVV